ncbi:triokinase/FMN cyclase isoform X2 [Halyomorpha halys]
MLTAYVSGKMGNAPRSGTILSVLVRLAELNKGGVLILILNYARDVLNFGLAIERGRCLGLQVEAVVLVDDCSRWKKMRGDQSTNLAYKKGVAGSVFAFKILGALSSAGASISHLVSEARNINVRLSTLGFVMEPFCFPGQHRPAYTLGSREVVIGMGINGETGIKSIEQTSARDVVRAVMSILCHEAEINRKSGVFVMVNRFTSMTVNESYVIAKEVFQYLAKKKISVWRLLVSQFMTSYDAKGAHITVLNVSGKGLEWLRLLEMETEAYAWPNTKMSSIDPFCEMTEVQDEFGPDPEPRGGMVFDKYESRIVRKVIESICRALIDAELVLNQLDTYYSNGNCGTNLRAFAYEVLQQFSHNREFYKDASMVFQVMERCAEEVTEGSIGSVYAALLCGASENATSWTECFQGAVKFFGIHYPVVPGFRTLFDVLEPTCEEFVTHYETLGAEYWRTALQLAVDKAEKTCVETYSMSPKVGLHTYGTKKNMDPGAYSIVIWMRAINHALKKLLPFNKVPPPETADWKDRLEYLLLTIRAAHPESPLKEKLANIPILLSGLDIEDEEFEEEEWWLEHTAS